MASGDINVTTQPGGKLVVSNCVIGHGGKVVTSRPSKKPKQK